MKYVMFLAAAIFIAGSCQSVATKNTDSGVPDVASDIRDISPVEARAAVSKAYSQFIDVRTPDEYSGGHAARAVNIPLDALTSKLDTLEKNEPVYLICQTGNRSKKAAQILKDNGFNNVLNVAGGTVAWQAANLPMETKPPHGAQAN
jgi:rhodanese-related sulfurtransferase